MHRATYSSSDPSGMGLSAKALAGGQVEAVFLPDSWKNIPGVHLSLIHL